MYIIKTIDRSEYEAEDSEALKVAEAMNTGKLKAVVIQGNIVVLSSISSIKKESKKLEDEEKDHKLGVLHDGTRVIRQFGQWMCMDSNLDEEGHYCTRPDPEYFPEVALDLVPSIHFYEKKLAQLTAEERKAAMIGDRGLRLRNADTGLQRLSVSGLLN